MEYKFLLSVLNIILLFFTFFFQKIYNTYLLLKNKNFIKLYYISLFISIVYIIKIYILYFEFLIMVLKYLNKNFCTYYLYMLEYKFLLEKNYVSYKNSTIENNKYKKLII